MAGQYPLPVSVDAERVLYRAIQEHCGEVWACELRRCLPLLIELVCEQPHTPACDLAPAIRRIICEQADCDEGGDANHHTPQAIEAQIELIVSNIESLRLNSASEHAHDAPAPLMCG